LVSSINSREENTIMQNVTDVRISLISEIEFLQAGTPVSGLKSMDTSDLQSLVRGLRHGVDTQRARTLHDAKQRNACVSLLGAEVDSPGIAALSTDDLVEKATGEFRWELNVIAGWAHIAHGDVRELIHAGTPVRERLVPLLLLAADEFGLQERHLADMSDLQVALVGGMLRSTASMVQTIAELPMHELNTLVPDLGLKPVIASARLVVKLRAGHEMLV
jgi:hypothetical protein